MSRGKSKGRAQAREGNVVRREGTMIYEDRPYREFDDGRIRVYGYSFDEQAVEQIRTVSRHGWVRQTALMADNHLGYSMPIGGVASYREMISPSGVGYDIGCGVMAVRTPIRFEDIRSDLPRLADEVFSRLSFGLGRGNPNPIDHELFDDGTWREVPMLTEEFATKRGKDGLLGRARRQLGTIGSGNHYCDVLTDENGMIWIATHFGSRGFGHGIATAYLNWAQGLPYHSGQVKGESMHAAPTLLPLTEEAAKELGIPDPIAATQVGQDYKKAMELAGRYAYAGREYVIDQVLSILGASETLETVHNHHNFSWTETHGGEEVQVVRKGETPAAPGQTGFIGGSMGDGAVVVRGVEGELAEKALRSTVHGAGRVMSRNAARGVIRKGVVKKVGQITREMMDDRLSSYRDEHGIPLELRGADVDESPFVYRQLDDVIRSHEETGTIEVVHRLLPVVVCMAGSDIADPFKD